MRNLLHNWQKRKMVLPNKVVRVQKKQSRLSTKFRFPLKGYRRPIIIAITLVTGVILSYQAGLRIFPFFNNSPDNQSVVIKKNRWGSWQYTVHQPNSQLKTHFSDSGEQAKVQLVRQNSKIEFRTPLESANLEQQDQNLVYTNRQQTQTIKYQTLSNGIKEEIILTQPLETNQVTTELVLTNLQGKLITQTPVFYDNDNNYQFHFEEPFVTDASGSRTYNVSYQFLNQSDEKTEQKAEPDFQSNPSTNETIQKISLLDSQELTFDQEQYTLVLTIDENWLNDPARTYPIVIDPTVIHDESSEFGGIYDRVKDTGSGTNPQLENYYQELAADPATIGLWHFNETVNNSCSGGYDTCDSSGNDHHGNEANTTITDGLMGKARAFNGGSSYINVGASVGAENITFEAWVYRTSSNNYQGIVRKNNSYALAIHNDTLKFAGNPWTWIDFGIPVEMNTWTHLAVVQNGTEAILYKNGILEATVAQNGNLAINSNPAEIGRDDFNNWYWGGIIDEVRISSIARTPEEIKAAAQRRPSATYTSSIIDLGETQVANLENLSWDATGQATGDGETPFSTQDLVAQWNLNETSGVAASVAGGSCGSSCNGTLVNFTNTSGQDVTPLSGWSAQHKRWGAGGLMYDGTDDYVQIADQSSLDITGELTISSWVKPLSISSNNHGGVGKYANVSPYTNQRSYGWVFAANSTTVTGYVSPDGTNFASVGGNRALSLGEWHQVVMTYKPSTSINIYVDGVLDAQTTSNVPASLNSSTAPLWIGTNFNHTDPTRFSPAVYDAVQIYSRALPDSEILSNYNATRVQFQTRTSADGTNWEQWKPTTGLISIDSMDSNQGWNNTADIINSGAPIVTTSSTLNVEGTASLKTEIGNSKTIAETIGLWHFDETGGTGAYLEDASSFGNHATPIGTSVVDGITGKARHFNGTSDYISIEEETSLQSDHISIEAWIKIDEFVPGAPVYNRRTANNIGGVTLELAGTNGIRFYVYVSGEWRHVYSGNHSLELDKWHHVAATFDGYVLSIFVDGNPTSINVFGSINNPPSPALVWIGRNISPSNQFFNGTIDEVRVHSYALSKSDVAESFRLGRGYSLTKIQSSIDLSDASYLPFYIAADEPGTHLRATIGETAFTNNQADDATIAHWSFEEEAGDSWDYLKDSSGNDHSGRVIAESLLVLTYAPSVQGVQGRAVQLDSWTPASLYFGTIDFGSGSYTISGWFNISTPISNSMNIFSAHDSNGHGIMLQVQPDAHLRALHRYPTGGSGGTNLYSQSIVADNRWHHFAFVYDIASGSLHLYLDGKLEATTITSGSFGNLDVLIGRIISEYDERLLDGAVDEYSISSVARSPSEIRQAYEFGHRSHLITIDFGASLDSTNLITNSADTSFTIDATTKGLSKKGENLFVGDRIIIKENYAGTEFIAQGVVSSISKETGAVTVSSWNSGSTFPSGGFSQHATVFKWQLEHWDLTGINPADRNAISNIAFRLINGHHGKSIWLDDLKANAGYLSNSLVSAITSTPNRYLQYRAIFTSTDARVSTQLSSVGVEYEYEIEQKPPAPDLISPGNGNSHLSNTPTLVTKVPYEVYPRTYKYKIELCTNAAMTANCQTFDQTASSTGWNDTEYTVSEPASYTIQTPLNWGTTYYWRSYAIAPDGLNIWSDTQSVPYSFTTNYPPSPPIDLTTESLINPDDITDLTPEFSSVYQDRDPLDTALAYEIEVNTEPDFSGTTIWSSGKQSLSPLEIYERSPEISYGGLDLQPLTTYFWRMRFWDSFDVQGEWSTMDAFFTTYDNFAPPACRVNPTPTATEFEVLWDDVVDETSYVLERNVNGSGFSTWTTKSANITSATDTNISAGNSYQYRVKSLKGSQSSQWCTTSTLQPGIGNLRVD